MRILNAQEVLLQPTDTLFGPSKIQAIFIFLICSLIFVPVSVMTSINSQWIGFALFALIGAVVLFAVVRIWPPADSHTKHLATTTGEPKIISPTSSKTPHKKTGIKVPPASCRQVQRRRWMPGVKSPDNERWLCTA